MKKAALFFFSIALVVMNADAQDRRPVAISPASASGLARVAESCPTFSWTSVEWATGFKVVVFETNGPNILSYEEMAAISSPVLSREIQGRALSWTPSSEERLSNGSMYVWYVQAENDYGQGTWSEGRMFKVETLLQLVGIEDAVRKSLRERGLSEGAIEDVLEDMNLGMKGVAAYGVDAEGGSSSSQDTFVIQGTEGSTNTFYGLYAGNYITSYGGTGSSNSFFGRDAGYLDNSGSHNTFIGYQAGYSNSFGNENTFVGYRAGYSSSASQNTYIGFQAGFSTSGFENTFIGYQAGASNTFGEYNTFVGYRAGYSNTYGLFNCFFGRRAGTNVSEGTSNTFVGDSAGFTATTGDYNTFLGASAGRNNSSGSGNLFLGCLAGYNETGSNKLYIDSSETSSPLIWGDFSGNILTVHGKLGVGTKSPAYQMELETTGENAIFLLDRTDGARTGFSASGDKAVFGTLTNHPLHCVINGIFRMELRPNGSMHMSTGARCTEAGVWVDASSREYKEDIQALSTEEAMDTLGELKPMKYRYKKEKNEQYLGFIAEDVPELVASKDRKNMSAMDVVAVLTKVVQEQQAQIEQQRKMIEAQLISLSILQGRIAALEKKP